LPRWPSLGRTINFDSKRCEGYRNFCNKLWNASRFVLMNCEGQDCGLWKATAARRGYMQFGQADRWIVSRLQKTEAEVAKGFADYRLDNVANTIYDFVWNEYCDWYLEIAKVQIQTGNAAAAARHAPHADPHAGSHPAPGPPHHPLHHRSAVAGGGARGRASGESVSIAGLPAGPARANIDEVRRGRHVAAQGLVDACRNLRGEMNVSPATRLPFYVVGDADFMRGQAPVLQALAKLKRSEGV
jgi:valyl-tRNA synthetase